MGVLRFNSQAFCEDMTKVLLQAGDKAMQSFYTYATSNMKAKSHAEIKKAELVSKFIIETKCVFYAKAILESYGTGENMDTSNEVIASYQQSSLWNTLRKTLAIVGRAKGKYINFFGEEVYSSGIYAGKRYWASKGVKPKYQIQNAERKLKQGINGGFVDRILQTEIEIFLKTASQYFHYDIGG